MSIYCWQLPYNKMTWNECNDFLIVLNLIQSPKPPEYIFWYHNERMINYGSTRDLSIQTETGSKTQSRYVSSFIICINIEWVFIKNLWKYIIYFFKADNRECPGLRLGKLYLWDGKCWASIYACLHFSRYKKSSSLTKHISK